MIMHHIAILDKKRKLLEKILSKEKTIESRWYKTKRAPWHAIAENDIVYFKDCGEPITAVAKVRKVLFFDKLNKEKVLSILQKYGRDIGFTNLEYMDYYDGKNYCVLIFLEDVKEVEPFSISKDGFGNACAWITVNNIEKIELKKSNRFSS